MRLPGVILLSGLMAGCAATGPSFTEHQSSSGAVPASSARLYFFRTRETAQYSARSASIKIDGNGVGGCDYAGFSLFDVTPGKHLVTVDMWDSPGTCALPIEVAAGNEYYLEIKPRTGNLIGALAGGLIGAAAESSGKECGGAFSVEPVARASAVPSLSDLKMTK
jgi:hypothetical protein